MVALGGRMDGAACRVDWSSGITPCAMSAERSWSAAKLYPPHGDWLWMELRRSTATCAVVGRGRVISMMTSALYLPAKIGLRRQQLSTN